MWNLYRNYVQSDANVESITGKIKPEINSFLNSYFQVGIWLKNCVTISFPFFSPLWEVRNRILKRKFRSSRFYEKFSREETTH